MNQKFVNFFKNFSYSFISNIVSILVSILLILILPKMLDVESYGYYQLYIFYLLYIGFFHLGWNDGIYLRYGGISYTKLNYSLFNSQILFLFLFQTIIAIVIVIISNMVFIDINKLFILYVVSFTMVIVNVRYMLIYILQATNRIKEFAIIMIIERILFVLITCLVIMLKEIDYRNIILADVISKIFSFIIAIIYCKEIVFRKFGEVRFNFLEIFTNIKVGINLMLANFASLLIIGIVRFGIERSWDVTTFGKVSLILSISNLIMIFVNAIGIILYPLLKRTNGERIVDLYNALRNFLSICLLGFLIFYFPLKVSLGYWLPSYSDSFIYMSLIFPIIVFEGKMALLINTYMKTLRKEKLLLIVNLITVILSIILTIISVIILRNLELAIFSIFILLAFKSIFAEILISKVLKIKCLNKILGELLVTLFFIAFNWYLNTGVALFSYGVIYFLYIIFNKTDISKSFIFFKLVIKK